MRCPPTEPVGGVLLDLGAATEILRFAQNDRGGQMTGRGECDGACLPLTPALSRGEREEEGERPPHFWASMPRMAARSRVCVLLDPGARPLFVQLLRFRTATRDFFLNQRPYHVQFFGAQ